MIKLIAVDLDGTFLGTNRKVSEENREMVEKVQKMGIKFIVNSGRTYEGVRFAFDEADITCDAICMNGASLYNQDGALVKSYYMNKKEIEEVITLVDSDEYFVQFNTEKGSCVTLAKEKAESLLRQWWITHSSDALQEEQINKDVERMKESFIYVKDINEIFEKGYDIFKVVITHTDVDKIQKLREILSQNPNIAVSASFPTNIEITDRKADKGLALESYARENEIKMEEVMAFGDSLNDYPMLKRDFGYTVAMANAMPEIKEVAKYQTLNNDEHGVAYFIQKILNSTGQTFA